MCALKLSGGKVVMKGGKPACTCCGPQVTFTCVSKTATPTLCGYSAFTDPNSGPIYKWQRRALSGESTFCFYGTSEHCSGAGTNGGRIVNSGAVQFDGCSIITYGRRDYYISSDCSAGTLDHSTTTAVEVDYYDGGYVPPSITKTSRTYTFSKACEAPNYDAVNTDAAETLSEPDTIEAAVARATPVTGSSCCAVTGIIGTTTAESTSPLAVGPSTTVVLTIELTGGLPSTGYTLRVWFKNYINSTDVELAETYVDIAVTTDGAGEWSDDLPIPQPASDRRTCRDRYEIDPE